MRFAHRLIALAIAAVVLLPTSVAHATQTVTVGDFVEQFAADRMTDAHVPGMVFVLVRQDGTVVGRSFGSADLASGRPMTIDTPLRVGSISKPVTAALALELSTAGLIDLDVPADHYLDRDLTDRYGSASTVRQLLHHRGGYPDAFVGSHHLDPDDAKSLETWARHLGDRVFAPDVVASYSSVGYTLAGAAIAGATGSSFAAVAAEFLFDPLNMGSATFAQPAPEDVAVGYRWDEDRYRAYPPDVPDLVPGAGLTAASGDIARFMHALLAEDSPLSPETRKGLLTVAGPAPGLRGYTTGLTEFRYAERTVLLQEGNGIGTTSRMMILPDEGVGIFTAVNGEALTGLGHPSTQTRFIRELHEAIIERFYPGPSTIDAAGRGNVTRPRDLTGTYVPTRVDPSSILRLEALVTQVHVADGPDNMTFDGNAYVVDADGVFRNDTRRVLFVEAADGAMYATTGGTSSYRQAAWWETRRINILWLGGSFLLLAAGLLIGLARSPRSVKALMAVTGVAAAAFVGLLGYGVATVEVMDLFTGLSTPIRLAQMAAALLLVATLALGATTVGLARHSGMTWRVGSGTAAVVTAGLALTTWAWMWAVLPI